MTTELAAATFKFYFTWFESTRPWKVGEFLPGAFLSCRRKECGAPGEGGRQRGSKCCKSGIRAGAKTQTKDREVEFS